MEPLLIVIQVFIALAICNVWIVRYRKPTEWRGGDARNLTEEFKVYGLPGGMVKVIGFFKLLCASLLIIGIWKPALDKVGAIGLAILMLGAVSMHLKVKDPFRKALPALGLLILCLFIVFN